MDGKNKKAIIFDMDGVLLDSEPLHENARQEMYRELNIVLDDTFPDPVGKSCSDFWDLILEKLQIPGNGVDKERQHYQMVSQQIEKYHVGPSEGLIELLQWAKRNGMKIGLASSSSRFLVDDALRLLNIETYFDFTAAGDEVAAKKPAPDLYLKVLDAFGLTGDEAIAVEDSRSGVAAAKTAGIYCFGYQNPTSGNQDLSQADQQIQKLSEIMNG